MYGRRHGKNRGENSETMVPDRDIGLQDSHIDIVFSGNIVFQEQIKSNFLWGMYGRRHGKNSCENSETMVPDRDIGLQDSHMEVDMADKEILGTVDVVVTKQSTESNIYVPPGDIVFSGNIVFQEQIKSNFLWGMYGRRHGKNSGENSETMVPDRDIGLQDSHMEVDMADKEILVDYFVTTASTVPTISLSAMSTSIDIVFSGNIVFQEQIKSNFLWGMYGRRHGKNSGENSETMVHDRDIGLQDSHMEVDMADKEILGTVDVVVTKQSTESNIYVPPGFSAFVRKQSYFIGTIIALS
ncbi:hypothetical protein POM88_000335 [Heracleum sosnowskyi]|uniref:Uncharacterized protein n=1 Tax=Heracleum sosnowskyi TaxID=360622 RepID=A0AAD8JA53_9APIA|nr:hypothetical protein POM88_000335 [Heracleum sosnowskyi]